jgi:probable HAF family extracellular repeat protein
MGDQEPPVFSVSPTPNLLWPADNKLAPVSLYVPVTDNCDPAPVCRVTGVTSNQPVTGPGYGNTTPDWIFTENPADLSLKLRAERSGAESRVYTIAVSCKDATGNEATTAARVTAPISPASHKVTEIGLGSLGGGWTDARAINDRGQVVGASATPDGYSHAFLWEKGIMTDLTPTPETYSNAVDINNRGQIVGTDGVGAFLRQNGATTRLTETWVDIRGINEPGQVLYTGYNDSGESRVYLWNNGTTKDLGGPIAEWDPVRMNDRGQVVVTAMFDYDLGWTHAYLWDKGEKIDLGTLGGAEPTAAMVFDINNRGQITGGSYTPSFEGHVFLWENGTITDLITMSGFFDSCEAPAINDLGQAIGSCTDASGNRQGYLWGKGKMISLGTLGGTYCEPRAINNSGQIVGSSTTASGEEHAFLWEQGTMIDLAPGSYFSNARLINSSGQIVGDRCDPGVGCSAVLWTAQR